MTYAEQLRDPRWRAMRERVLSRDGSCRWCGDGGRLEVHHKRYARGRAAWEYPLTDLVALCRSCHERITALTDEARDILASLNVYELPSAVAALRAAGPPEHSGAMLDRLGAEKTYLVGLPWTRGASRRVDDIDAEIDATWASLAFGAAY